MRILIDGRFYGLEHAGLGRYSMNLINQLAKIDTKNEYLILLRKKYFDELTFPDNWEKILADFKHYSLTEQIRLPKIIHKYEPDITHFLHFNVPLLFNGRFVVTIHDILMHKQKGREATTLPLPFYHVKRFAYKKVFKHAIHSSLKIIVPSETVKAEVVDYFKIDPVKVEVTYEGV